MLQKMQARNPDLFRKAQQMMQGKSEQELKEMAVNLGKERGIDVNNLNIQDIANKLGM